MTKASMMKKRLLLAVTLLLTVAGLQAQKIDHRLVQLLERDAQSRTRGVSVEKKAAESRLSVNYNADGSVGSMVVLAYLKAGAECPYALFEQMGMRVNLTVDNVVSLTVPADRLMRLADMDDIIYVEADRRKQLYNDVARKTTGADVITSQNDALAKGLPQAYSGRGVIIGIIDRGIDFNHAAFRRADGTSRVVKARLYKSESQYTDYTPADISGATTDDTSESHGTHVAAIAVGTDTGSGIQGVAPEADIVLVGIGTVGNNTILADAIKFVFDYAQSVGKPAVVSMSVGDIDCLHDGSTPTCKMIQQMTQNGDQPGRVVVMASGNSGDNHMSVVQKLGAADSEGYRLKTILGCTAAPSADNPQCTYQEVNVFMYADDGQDFEPRLRVVNVSTGTVADGLDGQLTDAHGRPASYKLSKGTRIDKDGRPVVVYITPSNTVTMKDANTRLAIFVKGSEGQTVKMVRTDESSEEPGFDAPATLAGKGYRLGDYGGIAFNGDATAPAAITVGSYNTRLKWINYAGSNIDFSVPPMGTSRVTGQANRIAEVSDFTSFGTDDNGTQHPLVLGPGCWLLSAFSNYDESTMTAGTGKVAGDKIEATLASASHQIADRFGRPHWYGYKQGTSMSTPHVAGIVALWLEANGSLTANQVRQIIRQTSVKDEWVSSAAMLPSRDAIQAGCGKIDALAGIRKALEATGISTVTSAAEADANAPVYNLCGQRVAPGAKGIVVRKGRKYVVR